MDCSIQSSKKYSDLFQVSTTDFFFPLINNPFLMGKIACANVLSDMYALGVRYIDNMLMLLSSSRLMSKIENDIVLRLIIEGFNEQASIAETEVTGGQTVQNEWLLIGGVAMSLCKEEEFIRPENAKEGDVIVLTKPLGTQVSVNLYEWLLTDKEKFDNINDIISEEEIIEAYCKATNYMVHLNKVAAELMHKYNSNGATDITGFGIHGHANNLALNQKNNVNFEIHTLPIIKNMKKVEEKLNNKFKLFEGKSSETSGGLFIILPKENANKFCEDIEKKLMEKRLGS